MMHGQEFVPPLIVQFDRGRGRPDSVGEEDGRQDTVQRGIRSDATHELLCRVEDLLRSAREQVVVFSRQLDELGTSDLVGEVATMFNSDVALTGTADKEGGRLHRGQDLCHVALHGGPRDGDAIGGRPQAFGSSSARAARFALHHARRQDRGDHSSAPRRLSVLNAGRKTIVGIPQGVSSLRTNRA